MDKNEFYEFLTRLSRAIVTGSSTKNYVHYLGESSFIGGKHFVGRDLELAQQEEDIKEEIKAKLLDTKKLGSLFKKKADNDEDDNASPSPHKRKDKDEPVPEIEGFLPYYITLDTMLRQIEQKI